MPLHTFYLRERSLKSLDFVTAVIYAQFQSTDARPYQSSCKSIVASQIPHDLRVLPDQSFCVILRCDYPEKKPLEALLFSSLRSVVCIAISIDA